MVKPINSYSNICLPKNISNSYRLALNGLRFQPDGNDNTGYFLKIDDINGEVGLSKNVAELSGFEIQVSNSFTDNIAPKFSSIFQAVAYTNTLGGSQTIQANILVPAGV